MKIYWILVLVFPLYIKAQKAGERRDTSSFIIQPNRLEFPLTSGMTDCTLINGGEDGLLVVIENFKNTQKGQLYHIIKLDTSLQQQWTSFITVESGNLFTGYDYYDGKYYLLITKSQYLTDDLIVFEVNGRDQIVKKEITTVVPLTLSHFEVIGETILLAGSTNSRPVIMTFNMRQPKPTPLPGIYSNRNDLLDIKIDDEKEMFTVILKEKMVNREFSIRAKTFTSTGILVQDMLIKKNDRRNLLDAASTTFEGGTQFLAGAFSRKGSTYSVGLYLSKFINGQQKFLNYVYYDELSNFFGYLGEKRETRIKERIDKRKVKGKSGRYAYRMLIHDVIQQDENTNILVGEAYYPRYATNNYGYNSFRYRGYQNNFIGYRFTHAVVVAYDNSGQKIWDHSFKIKDVDTYTLDETVSVASMQDKTVLMYLENNEIRSKVVRGNEVVEGKTYNPIKLVSETEKIRTRNPSVEGLDYWYGNTFYAYGIQSIAPKRYGIGNSRRVFYINSIAYDEGEPIN